jgi:PAS domain S-box-containing protein
MTAARRRHVSNSPPRDHAQHESSSGSPAAAFSRFLEHAPATIWTTDDRMVLTFIAGALIRTLQVDTSRIIGRTLPDLLLDGREDHPLIQAHIAALGGHETTVRIEWGGDLFSARIAPLRDADGRVVGCAGVQQVIGWLPDETLTVREGEIRLQRIIDWNIVGIAFGDDQGRITDANEAFLELVGCSREDVSTDGISWPELLPVEFHQRQMQALEEILATGRCTPFESEIVRPDGRRVAVLIGAARLSAGRREGVAFVLDVSPYRRAEAWVRAELAAADALADAADAEAGVAAVLRILCVELDWAGAWVWTAGAGTPRPTAHHGTVKFKHSTIAALAAQTIVTGESTWSAEHAALALPLGRPGDVLGAIVLIDHAADGPEQPRVAATRSIVARLAKFLARAKS